MNIGNDQHIVAMTTSNLLGISARTGTQQWQVPFAPTRMSYNAPSPIVHGQTVFYAASGRGTHAVKIEKQGNGFAPRKLWSNDELGSKFSTPVLKDGLLYGLSDRGRVYCLNAATGETAWTSENSLDRQGFAVVLDAGEVMLVLPANADLVVFKPNTKEFVEIARVRLSDKDTYAHPVIAGNKIFVKDREGLALLTLP